MRIIVLMSAVESLITIIIYYYVRTYDTIIITMLLCSRWSVRDPAGCVSLSTYICVLFYMYDGACQTCLIRPAQSISFHFVVMYSVGYPREWGGCAAELTKIIIHIILSSGVMKNYRDCDVTKRYLYITIKYKYRYYILVVYMYIYKYR